MKRMLDSELRNLNSYPKPVSDFGSLLVSMTQQYATSNEKFEKMSSPPLMCAAAFCHGTHGTNPLCYAAESRSMSANVV